MTKLCASRQTTPTQTKSLSAARQGRRAQKQTNQLRTYLGQVIQDIERNLVPVSMALPELLEHAKHVYRQQKQDSNKCGERSCPRCRMYCQRQGAQTLRV